MMKFKFSLCRGAKEGCRKAQRGYVGRARKKRIEPIQDDTDSLLIFLPLLRFPGTGITSLERQPILQRSVALNEHMRSHKSEDRAGVFSVQEQLQNIFGEQVPAAL